MQLFIRQNTRYMNLFSFIKPTYLYKHIKKPTKKVVAIKSIKPKLILNADTMRYVETEIEIMRNICHPHLISCKEYIVIPLSISVNQ